MYKCSSWHACVLNDMVIMYLLKWLSHCPMAKNSPDFTHHRRWEFVGWIFFSTKILCCSTIVAMDASKRLFFMLARWRNCILRLQLVPVNICYFVLFRVPRLIFYLYVVVLLTKIIAGAMCGFSSTQFKIEIQSSHLQDYCYGIVSIFLFVHLNNRNYLSFCICLFFLSCVGHLSGV